MGMPFHLTFATTYFVTKRFAVPVNATFEAQQSVSRSAFANTAAAALNVRVQQLLHSLCYSCILLSCSPCLCQNTLHAQTLPPSPAGANISFGQLNAICLAPSRHSPQPAQDSPELPATTVHKLTNQLTASCSCRILSIQLASTRTSIKHTAIVCKHTAAAVQHSHNLQCCRMASQPQCKSRSCLRQAHQLLADLPELDCLCIISNLL